MDATQQNVLLQILGVVIGNSALIIPLWLWNRSESRADMRHLENRLEKLVDAIKDDVKAIQAEMKDFHGRMERQDADFKAHLLHKHKGENGV